MRIIELSAGERANRKLSDESVASALDALDRDGFVVIDQVARPEHLDAIYRRMLEDLKIWPTKRGDGKEFVGGNIRPARDSALLFDDVLQNPYVADVLGAAMGREPTCGMYSSNVTMPGMGDQQLHSDQAPLTEGETLDYPCGSCVVNFPLVDFTEANGATEIWPGTHRVPRRVGEFWVNEDLQATRRDVRPPERAVIRKGAVLIRDIRLWHRGVINKTDIVRPMIAMICNGKFKPGVDAREKLPQLGPFPEASRGIFENAPRIHYNVTYGAEPIDYLVGEQK
jgi:hypothetical protein